jgi:glycosyltransferase involved in cell wall biosynthesis
MCPQTPTVSVVMPVYNVRHFVADAVRSVLDQTHRDLELIIVDDGGSDDSIAICERLADDRTTIVRQANRGLSGARNTGIAAARGTYIALLDSDDLWDCAKLQRHVAHLKARPMVGISYSGAIIIDQYGRDTGMRQQPLVGPVSSARVFCGQAVCNGSTPVFRRAVFQSIAYEGRAGDRDWYFDETLRRSEDVECWTRIALTTPWLFEGIPGFLTHYRLNSSGLSADVIPQLASWDAVLDKIKAYAPEFVARHGAEARARELRYLARRCVQMRERRLGLVLAREAIRTCPSLMITEPRKTMTTLAACAALALLPEKPFGMLLRSVRPAVVQGEL